MQPRERGAAAGNGCGRRARPGRRSRPSRPSRPSAAQGAGRAAVQGFSTSLRAASTTVPTARAASAARPSAIASATSWCLRTAARSTWSGISSRSRRATSNSSVTSESWANMPLPDAVSSSRWNAASAAMNARLSPARAAPAMAWACAFRARLAASSAPVAASAAAEGSTAARSSASSRSCVARRGDARRQRMTWGSYRFQSASGRTVMPTRGRLVTTRFDSRTRTASRATVRETPYRSCTSSRRSTSPARISSAASDWPIRSTTCPCRP